MSMHNFWTAWRKDPALRAKASEALIKLTGRVGRENKSLEQLKAEDARTQVMRGGVPVMWTDPSGRRLAGRNAHIRTADGHELSNFAVAPAATCAECKHFDIANGRKEIVKQRFAERLVLEEEWALRHLGGEVDHMGLCGETDGGLATFTMSVACANFRRR